MPTDRLQGLSEVVQNAEDLGATEVRVLVRDKTLLLAHNGRPIRLTDVIPLSIPWVTSTLLPSPWARPGPHQGVSMPALHLLQSALVHLNTLLVQEVLAGPKWADELTEADCRALSPLFWTHANSHGWFALDMNSRLELDLSVQATVPGPRTPQGEGTSTTVPGLAEAVVLVQPGSVASPIS